MDNCSICLKNQTAMVSLKEIKVSCSYITMLESCVPEVNWKAEWKICTECTGHLEAVYSFKQICLRTDKARSNNENENQIEHVNLDDETKFIKEELTFEEDSEVNYKENNTNVDDRLNPKPEPNRLNFTRDRAGVAHFLREKIGFKRKTRRRCKNCFSKLSSLYGSKIAARRTKQVSTYCENCPGSPHYCLACYNETHSVDFLLNK